MGDSFSGVSSKCNNKVNSEQFCNIIVHNSLKFAWNCFKFCENIDPNILYRCTKFERKRSTRKLFLHALKFCVKKKKD